MKKRFSILIFLSLIVLSLISCSDSKDTSESKSKITSTSLLPSSKSNSSIVTSTTIIDESNCFNYRNQAGVHKLLSAYNEDGFKNDTKYNDILANTSVEFAMKLAEIDTSDSYCDGKYAIEYLEDKGFSNIEANYDFQLTPTNESSGVLIGKKKITIDNTEYTLLAVGARSGRYSYEWLSNFNIGIEGDHPGFKNAATIAYDYLKDYIEKYSISLDNLKLWLTGYSRGGGVINVLSKMLDEEIYNKNQVESTFSSLDYNDIYSYTFEAPRGVLKDSLTDADYSNIHNLFLKDDLVQNVMPELAGFVRAGEEIEIEITDLDKINNFLKSIDSIVTYDNLMDYYVIDNENGTDFSIGSATYKISKSSDRISGYEAYTKLFEYLYSKSGNIRELIYNTIYEPINNIYLYINSLTALQKLQLFANITSTGLELSSFSSFLNLKETLPQIFNGISYDSEKVNSYIDKLQEFVDLITKDIDDTTLSYVITLLNNVSYVRYHHEYDTVLAYFKTK